LSNTFVTGLKQFTTILITFIYFAVSCGLVINTHYCMGKPAGVKYHAATASNHCDNCGMDNSGCCHDNIQVVKLENVQNSVAAIHFKLPALKPLLQEHDYTEATLLQQHFYTAFKPYNNSHPPGVNPPSRSILYAVFRI